MQIQGSVGAKGINSRLDVRTIQTGLNRVLFKGYSTKLTEDGLMGPHTLRVILRFQREIIRMVHPDGRIDPNGRSLKVLSSYSASAPSNTSIVSKGHSGSGRSYSAISAHGPSAAFAVNYRANAKRVLSHYTISVLKQIMMLSGVNNIAISSTWRTPDDQARIMFGDNKSAYSKGVSVEVHRGYPYKPAGKAVDKIFSDNMGKKTDAEIKQLMINEIIARLANGERTSLHCVTQSQYQSNNILDIPYSSVKDPDKAAFEEALLAYSANFNKRKHSAGSKTNYTVAQKPIANVLIERSCWHVELPQINQLLPLLP
ncbi:peptidoglycan-binding domain-containing protein [Agarivorans gilvus]|uniref:Peptidoglycan binding-like domain-containing protein n=1 Tax=Agarivorans gilvus TaxID=680279 RepID=A0ABQ1I666_9ALTE|nr:hypothetical protein [Agarivorans gilvus]GGB16958.1 hypothetical protein GCM10007414_33010 [Agarivorans gilvus]